MAERMAVNHDAVGSSPTVPVNGLSPNGKACDFGSHILWVRFPLAPLLSPDSKDKHPLFCLYFLNVQWFVGCKSPIDPYLY